MVGEIPAMKGLMWITATVDQVIGLVQNVEQTISLVGQIVLSVRIPRMAASIVIRVSVATQIYQ